jgi:hypothetical protein
MNIIQQEPNIIAAQLKITFGIGFIVVIVIGTSIGMVNQYA